MTGLLGADELNRLKSQAQSDAMLNMATALLQAGAPSRVPGGGGALAIAQGLQQGQQAYKNALQQGLQEKVMAMQVGEMARKQQEAEQIRQIMPRLVEPGRATPEQIQEYFTSPAAGVPSVNVGVQPTLNREAAMQLMLASPEAAARMKPLMPEYKEAGGVLYEVSPFGGATPVAGSRKEDLAGPVKEAMQVLGIQKPLADLTPQERQTIGNYIDRKEAMKAPKVAVDLRDPTAVAKAQKDIMESWRSTVKDSGATEIANRFRALGAALQEANSGNANADGAIIYNIGKIYDPSGAVQEGDKQTILGNRSIPESFKAYAQRVFKGGSLTPTERTNLYNVAGAMLKQRQQQLAPELANYRRLAQELGGTGDYVVDPFANVFSPKQEQAPITDWAAAAAAELARRKKGQ